MTHVESTARIEFAGLATRRSTLESKQALDRFLAGVERRAFVMARISTRNSDEAMDIVQDAMLRLVQYYGTREERGWGPLFHRVLQPCIYDWYRRARLRNRWRHLFTWGEGTESHPLKNKPGPAQSEP